MTQILIHLYKIFYTLKYIYVPYIIVRIYIPASYRRDLFLSLQIECLYVYIQTYWTIKYIIYLGLIADFQRFWKTSNKVYPVIDHYTSIPSIYVHLVDQLWILNKLLLFFDMDTVERFIDMRAAVFCNLRWI